MNPKVIYNQEAEEALVACALVTPSLTEEVAGFFKVFHFHLEHLRGAWGAIDERWRAGKTVDVLVVSEEAGAGEAVKLVNAETAGQPAAMSPSRKALVKVDNSHSGHNVYKLLS